MNGRTALGAGLVVLAVLAGALFLDRAQQLVPVYAAARDLPAGTSLKNGDLMVVRVRLPATALRHYLQPGPGRGVVGRVLVAPVRREALVPEELVLGSSLDADLVELAVQADPGDMAQGLRPGDRVQVLAAFTEGARRGRAVVLLPSAQVVQVLQDPAGLTGAGQERGVQLRMPSDRAPVVAAAIATARIFVVKAPGPATEPATAAPPPPTGMQEPGAGTSQPEASQPETSQPGTSQPDTSQPDVSAPDVSAPGAAEPGAAEPDPSEPDPSESGASQLSASEPVGSLSGGEQPGATTTGVGPGWRARKQDPTAPPARR